MGHRVVATRKRRRRAAFHFSSGRGIIVWDDPELIFDDDYAEGVAEALEKAWEDDDYFEVEFGVFQEDSTFDVTDTANAMAGYGGPNAAACAAARDYFSLSEAERRELDRVAGCDSSSSDVRVSSGRGVKVVGLDGATGSRKALPSWIRRR